MRRRRLGGLALAMTLTACSGVPATPGDSSSSAAARPSSTEFGALARGNIERLGLDVRTDPGDLSESGVTLQRVTWAFPGEPAATAPVPAALIAGEATNPSPMPGVRAPLWLVVPLASQVTGKVRVVAAPEELQAWSDAAAAAWQRVTPWLLGSRAEVTVEVAPDGEALTAALAGQSDEFSGVAAVTSTTDGSLGRQAPVHVFVDASQVDPGTIGAEILLAHEFVHALTRSPLHPNVPIWWREGYADYVAFAGGGIPPALSEFGLLDGPQPLPRRLPDEQEFTDYPDWAYPGSRWVVRTAVRLGLPGRSQPDQARALLRIDQRLRAGESLAQVLREELGVSPRKLTSAWWKRLQHWQP